MQAEPHPLPPLEVHIWQFRLDQAVNSALPILSSDEQLRADRLKISAVRSRFIAARVTLRQILSEYTGIPAADLRFRYNPDGKPELDFPATHPPLYFNLTHSGDHALLALAHRPVGVDLEPVRPLTGLEYIMNTALTAGERHQINSLSEDRKIFTFFRFWVSKEAVMKAIGGGFKLASRIQLELSDQGVLVLHSLPDDEPEQWSLREIPSPGTTPVALAVRQPNTALRLFNRD